jgi:D-beta-D-heptose 7-phosphate kinase/D-beta-D-heptose 1-phosphate adenosyltransferase
VACQSDEDSPGRKLVTAAELEQICRSLRQNGRRIVFTNGFFDLLHHGHIRLLSEARKMGDCLIVAINSDASTRRLKGEPRPILKSNERIDLLAALPSVDYITIFDGNTPEELLRRLRPDILVKGGGSGARKDDVVGAEFVEGYGGQVRLVELKDEPRISAILERAAGQKKTRQGSEE